MLFRKRSSKYKEGAVIADGCLERVIEIARFWAVERRARPICL
jgi:hypothetical protein